MLTLRHRKQSPKAAWRAAAYQGAPKVRRAGGPDGLAPGDWVLIHVGFALSKIDEAEAARTIRFLEELGDPYQQELSELARSRIE